MRILLAQNSLYFPAHGGGDKSNRLLMEALAARGHECCVVARISEFSPRAQERYLADLQQRDVSASLQEGVVQFERCGVDVYVSTLGPPRTVFARQAQRFQPEAILASTDDPQQVLLQQALEVAGARVIYLARATLALPFGPDAAFRSETKTERLRACGRLVGVSEYVAEYARRYAGIDAVHVPISLIEREDWPELGQFENEFVTMVNPCAVKGIDIFLALADSFPKLRFAAVPTWGTNPRDRVALEQRSNVEILPPVDNIDRLLARTRVLLVPSVWAEARSRIVLEAMLRGVPVIASKVGGIPEAKMGVPYLLPVRPIERYQPALDEQLVPIAEVPPQDIGPWRSALARLTEDPEHYRDIATASRRAALQYVSGLSVEPFERLLGETPTNNASKTVAPGGDALSAEKRKLLAIRLRKRAPAASWFPGIDVTSAPRVFCFPHAGGGTSIFGRAPAADLNLVSIRLPGRESRSAEAPFERMQPLVAALADAIGSYVDQPYAFFGHSMGAIVAFELARELRRRGLAQPRMLIASGARAPEYRLNHVPPADPSDDELLADLRRLSGTPAELLEDPRGIEALLPSLRADTILYRHYIYTPEPPFDFPVRAYGGAEDPNISSEHLDRWDTETTAGFAVRRFPGGHFYLQQHRDEVLSAMAEDLAAGW